jgi:hypothetical protein
VIRAPRPKSHGEYTRLKSPRQQLPRARKKSGKSLLSKDEFMDGHNLLRGILGRKIGFMGGPFGKRLKKICSLAYRSPGPPQEFRFKPIEFRSGRAIEKEVSNEIANPGPRSHEGQGRKP